MRKPVLTVRADMLVVVARADVWRTMLGTPESAMKTPMETELATVGMKSKNLV
jgi:hypothetical protein